MRHLPAKLILFIIALGIYSNVSAQLLNKHIATDIQRKTLKEALVTIGKKGDFYFSYNSNIINGDSIVTIHSNNQTVKQILDGLFHGNIEYKETSNHIILQRTGEYWYVSGYIIDERTGQRLHNASVYDKEQLVAALTNSEGYFKLRLKDKVQYATISVSKSWYSDTSVIVRSGGDKELQLSLYPKNFELDSITISSNNKVEKNWLSKFFLSSKQRVQGINLDRYFVDKPYQASVIPGVSTHGRMSSTVVNKFSFNVLGGYTAGVNGFEIGGIFNIVKRDMYYTQIGGVFNIIGGNVNGVQIGGLYNQVFDSVEGLQIGGIANIAGGSMSGVQISGIYNHVAGGADGAQITGLINNTFDTVNGAQIAGLANYAKRVDGLQVSGLGNIAAKEVNGTQISSLFNYAKRMNGTQIGIINIADTSTGYSVGLINLIRKGYHKLSVSTDETVNLNAAFKTGNANLYSIILAGYNVGTDQTVFTFGYGIGAAHKIKGRFSLSPEFTAQHLYLGSWGNVNLLSKIRLNLNFKVNKYISVFGGPSASFYYTDAKTVVEGFKSIVPGKDYATYNVSNEMFGWFGWQAGIDIF